MDRQPKRQRWNDRCALTLNTLHLSLLRNEKRGELEKRQEEKEEGRRLGKSGRAARDGDEVIRGMEGKKERDKQKSE